MEPRHVRRMLMVSCVMTAMLVLLAACGGSSKGKETLAAMQARDLTVTAQVAKGSVYTKELSQTGITEAIREVQLESRVMGYVENVHFEDGAIVTVGEQLIQLDPRPFEASLLQARGNLESAVAARNLAYRTVERNRPLVPTGAISREQFDNDVTSLEQSESAVEVAAGQLVDAELNLGYTTIRAPFAGRLGQREVELGDLVQTGSSSNLVGLVQFDPMRVLVGVPAKNLETLLALQAKAAIKASVRVNGTRGGGGRVFEGVVDFIDNTVSSTTSTVNVRVRFANAEALAYPGQYAEVALNFGTINDAIIIPQEAVRADQGGQFVWLLDDKNKITKQVITVNATRDGKAWIGKGIRAGQKFMVLGGNSLQSGDIVQIKTDPKTDPKSAATSAATTKKN